MKKLFTYVLMLCASLSVSVAQQIQYPEPILNPESCTSIMVGKKATPAIAITALGWISYLPPRTITIRQPRSIPDVCIPNTPREPGG